MKTYGSLVVCVSILAATVGCDPATLSVPGAEGPLAAPALPAAVQEAGSVLGRVRSGVAFNVTLTTNNGGTTIINNEAVTLLPIGLAGPGDVARDAAGQAADPQDGRVFYSVNSTLAGNTQARVSIKSVPATVPIGLDDFIHGFTIFIRATSTTSVTTRGENPLIDFDPAVGDIAVVVTNVQMLDTAGNPFATVVAEAPREYYPPTLDENQRPMVMFLRSGGIGQAGGGKFIHIAGVLPNVIDSDQTRNAANGGDALGSGFASAQVTGEFAAASGAYTFAAAPDDANAATGEFTWTIDEVAYDGTVDLDSGQVYADAALPIGTLPNPLPGTGEVYEIAVATVMVTQ